MQHDGRQMRSRDHGGVMTANGQTGVGMLTWNYRNNYVILSVVA